MIPRSKEEHMGQHWTVMVKPANIAEVKKQVRDLIDPYTIDVEVEDSQVVYEPCPDWDFHHRQCIEQGEECDWCNNTGQRRQYHFNEAMAIAYNQDHAHIYADGIILPDRRVFGRAGVLACEEAAFNPNYNGPVITAEYLHSLRDEQDLVVQPLIADWKAKGYIPVAINNRSNWYVCDEEESDDLLGLWAVKYNPKVLRRELVVMCDGNQARIEEAMMTLGVAAEYED